MKIAEDLKTRKASMAVIGLGYVGLPVALAFSKQLQVVAFDEKPDRISQLQQGIDINRETAAADFDNCHISFTGSLSALKDARFFLVAVPTPVDSYKIPDLTNLVKATESIGKCLKKGDYVVYESTVYPGCTEEECVPLLEKISGLRCGIDFKIGYSPERINPGDTKHSFSNTIKVVSGCDDVAMREIAAVYKLVVTAGVHMASSIKVAEASKIVENTQRDLNISLMNELSIIFDKLGINTGDVLDAAGTKWNFMKFIPGLVGGHCIDVDPYYLTHKAEQLGYHSKVIAAGRSVNDEMPGYVSKKIIQHISRKNVPGNRARILVMGATFKENVNDIRNSKVIDLVKELMEQGVQVDFVDPHADPAAIENMYGIIMASQIDKGYDAIILAVAHDEYTHFSETYLLSISNPNAIFADLKGVYRHKISQLVYWSL